jgi:uncharacterized membrane protein
MTDVSPVSPISPTATRLQWLAPVALLAVLFAMSWWAYDRLPPRIDLQTLFSGGHGQSQSAAQVAFLIPALVAVVTIANLLAAHWNVLVWPRKALSSRDAAVMWPLAIRLIPIGVAQFIVVQAFTLAAALGWISEIAGLRGAGVVFSLGFAVMGNWLPLVTRPNPFIGYRLTVLYNDPERWRKAQRMAGHCFVAAGLLLALLFVVAPMLGNRLLFPVFAVVLLAPVLLTRRRSAQRESA